MSIVNRPYTGLSIMGRTVEIEPYNRRIKIYQLPDKHIDQTMNILRELGHKRKCDKLIFYVTEADKDKLRRRIDCFREGMIKGFFQGKDAFIYSMFLDPTRKQPITLEEEQRVFSIIKNSKKQTSFSSLPAGYVMTSATEHDAVKMAVLYDEVFESYPTPMNDPEFIVEMMHNNNVDFTVVKRGQEIVSACSAGILPAFNSAEMSDCATLPEHREKRLLTHQFSHLIKRMKEKGVQTLFSYSRAVSVGMNLINVKHGFTYGGRMIQNSNISGRLESMNIWFKNI